MILHDIKIAPSVLSANFANLEKDIKKCEAGGADILHVDVMDGIFVPNITIGPIIVEAIRRTTNIPIACHLMITDAAKYIDQFVAAGADYISVHVEGLVHLHRTLNQIRSHGIKAGIALNPATPLNFAYESAEHCDFILLMSVDPGFGGQKFIPTFLRRSEKLKDFLLRNQLDNVEIEVDGGVKLDNIEEIIHAGASMLVAGSSIFNGDISSNIIELRKRAENARNQQELF